MSTHLYVWYFAKSVPGMKFVLTSCANADAPQIKRAAAKTMLVVTILCLRFMLIVSPWLISCKKLDTNQIELRMKKEVFDPDCEPSGRAIPGRLAKVTPPTGKKIRRPSLGNAAHNSGGPTVTSASRQNCNHAIKGCHDSPKPKN